MAESRLDVVINPARAQSGARAVKSSIDSLKNSWVEFTAKIFLAEQTATRTWRALSQGAEFDENFARLNRQAGLYNQTSTQLVRTLQQTVNGQLSMAEATQISSRALAQGLNPDQINAFAGAADALGDVMGTDVKAGFDTLLQGLRSGKTQALSDIGVYVDLEREMKTLAQSTGRSTDEITKQEKAAIAANAIMKQLPNALDRLGDGSVSNADKMKAMEKKLEDIALSAKKAGVGLLFGFFAATEQATAKVQEAFPIFKQWGDWVDEHLLGVPKMQLDTSAKPMAPPPKPPPDPGFLRKQLEEEIKQRQDAMQRGVELQQIASDRELAIIKRGIVTRDDMDMTALDAMKNEHQVKMNLLSAEETQIQNLINLENERFRRGRSILETTDEKALESQKHQGALKELQDQLKGAKGKTGLQAQLFDIEEFEAAGQAQEALGERIQDSLNSTFQIGEDLRHREQDDTIMHYQNLAKYQDAYGTSRENQIHTQYAIVTANLAKTLDVNIETAEKVLNAWRNQDEEQAQILLEGTTKTTEQITAIWMGAMADQREVSLKFSDDFFDGFARSMKRYVDDNSMLGLGVDQARRVAQGMEQGFQKFFFDAMEGRVQSLKDVLGSLLDFTKQIMSQMAGQLLTQTILRGVVGGFGGGMGGGASPVLWLPSHRNGGIASFADGGIAHRPMLRWAGGGMNLIGEGTNSEAYIPLPDGKTVPVTMAWKGPYGIPAHTPEPKVSVPISIQIVNQHTQAEVQTQQRQGANGMQQIDILITQKIEGAIASGKLDPAMRSRYATSPALTRR